MAYFKKLQIQGNQAKRVNKPEIDFQPGVNLLIGPNGSGKSTVLKILKDNQNSQLESKITTCGQGKMFSFDFEKDNPRNMTGGFSRSQTEFNGKLAAIFSSHGETVKAIITKLTDPKSMGATMLMDEPEQALDLVGIQELITLIKNSTADQIIVATHSPFLILEPGFHIIELEDGYKTLVKQAISALNKKAV